ncbi:Alkyldihydroxyacetonephosphate synthase [hydrothermal vent metagenome]|uniref:Alkyldihydroxyacetonephosphate synthase n=1 Tax=hydrothermal vent metagenome TaxID=652676 RepID=A0A3B0T074_9ZZZZ
MRRWNGWGDDSVGFPVSPTAMRLLADELGPGTTPRDATPEEVLATVPDSRLPEQPLVSTFRDERLRHARGQSLPDWVALRTGRIDAFPDGVAHPESPEDIDEIFELVRGWGASAIPFGGGTSVVGHVNPLAGDTPTVTIDMRRLNRLISIDKTSRLATFEAGVSGPELEAQLRAVGLTLGHYPQSFEYSTLGGWIATRSSGQQSLGYGRIEDLFAGGVVRSPAGVITLPTFPASAAGPDLRQLVLGSEGRAGVITEATVRVTPVPEREEFHAIFFDEFAGGHEAIRALVQEQIPLSMLRLSSADETRVTLTLAGRSRKLALLEGYLGKRGLGAGKVMLLMGFTGTDVRRARRASLRIVRSHGGVSLGRSLGARWKKGRFSMPYLRNTLWDLGYAVDTLETATTWTALPGLMKATTDALSGALRDEQVLVFSHISHAYPDGAATYVTYLFRSSPDPNETLSRWRTLKDAASRAIVAHGGTISHQHGVGLDHRPYLEAEKSPAGVMALGGAFTALDPDGIMNPGKLLP